jgi:pimeloyl-ACP methyl ester carboxylesterase
MSEILLLPGMANDRRLFDGLTDSVGFTVPPWPEWRPTDTLQSFAARLASSLTGPPDVVGGASFGGMVALEMAAVLRPRAVVLLGSARSPDAIAAPLRRLGGAAAWLPGRAFHPRAFRAALPLLLRKRSTLDDAQRARVRAMWESVSGPFLKWSCRAVLAWRPTDHDVPVFHLHGDRDRLIPIEGVRPTEVLRGAGHLFPITHPAEVAAFIRRITMTPRGAC